MPFTLTMPKLSPTMEEGNIVKWHKRVGDEVKAGDLLIEVATDKATVEFNAIDAGWLKKILIEEGHEAIVNQAIAILTESKDESIEGYKPEGVERIITSETAPSQEEATPAHEEVQQKPTKSAGVGLQQPAFTFEPPLENYEFHRSAEIADKRILASPLARKLAKESHLDLSAIKGSGPNGRIMSRDLEKAQPSGVAAFGKRERPQHKPGSYEQEALTPMRKVIAQRLQEAKTFIPHFYVTQAINVEALINTRDQLSNTGIKVTYNDFIIKACAAALREHPNVNSGFDSVNKCIVKFQTIDIAVAVSVPAGLITPIVRYADFKNLGDISLEVRSLAKKAKEGKLEASEYKGGSFTISNLGMYGVSEFVAIINPPQAAILAISGIQNVPVVKNNEIVPGKIMNITLSADHRVIDGVAAAEFLKTVQKYLENPAILLI